MKWFSRILKGDPGTETSVEDIIRFYQQLGFFAGAKPESVVKRYEDEWGKPPKADDPWIDVWLLSFSENDVWCDDPEADVCAENEVYSEVLAEWGRISHGAFLPTNIVERWESDTGPVAVNFHLEGLPASVSPSYQEDWIDLEVLDQINVLIAHSGRQFECAVDGNFAFVVCLTPEQKSMLQTQRNFPFA